MNRNTIASPDNGIDRMLCRSAEQTVLNSIEDGYRHSRRHMSTRQYVVTLALATVAVAVISLTLMSVVASISTQPGLSAGEICGRVAQMLIQQ